MPHCLFAAFVEETYLNNKSILNILHPMDDRTELLCLAGVLNSAAESVFYKATAVKSARSIFPKVVAKNLAEFPYPVAIQDETRQAIARLVEQLMRLHSGLAAARVGHDKSVIDREVAAIDHQIDQLVYGLYGITDDEIAVVESARESD